MRIKNTGIRFHDRDRLIERLDRNRGALILRRSQNDGEIQLQFLRLQLRREFVADALALPGRDLDAVARGGQVADDAGAVLRGGGGEVGGGGGPEGAADEDDGYGFGLFVGDGEDGLGGLAVDELDAEDFGGGEGGGDFDGEVGGLGLVDLFFFFFLLHGLIGKGEECQLYALGGR